MYRIKLIETDRHINSEAQNKTELKKKEILKNTMIWKLWIVEY